MLLVGAIGWRYGRGPAIAGTVAAVLVSDYYFLAPQGAFRIASLSDGVRLLTGILAVAAVVWFIRSQIPLPVGRAGWGEQDWRVFRVRPYMASHTSRINDSSDAALEIPTDWLMPGLDLEAVREAQRPDTTATLTGDYLFLAGVELVVERRWLREANWRQIKQAITRGYIYRNSAVQVTLRGERREHERRGSKAA